MAIAERATNLVQRASRAYGALQPAGLTGPSFLYSLARGALECGPSLGTGLAAGARLRGGEPAVIDDAGTTSFDQLLARSRSIAQGLRATGVGPGHNVAIMCRNHRGFVEATVATSMLGADSLFVNTGFAAPQLDDVLTREQAATVVYDEEFEPIVSASAGRRQRFLAWRESESSISSLDDLIAENAPETPPRPGQMGRTTILTSGTTGTPKGANRSSANAGLDAAIGLLERLPLRVGATTFICAPTFHAWGLTHALFGTLFANTLVLQRRFEPEKVLAAIERHRVEVLAVVPVMMQRILALERDTIERYDTTSVRLTAVSGSALPGELALRWMDTFGDNVHNMYGSTEVSVASIALPHELRAAPGTAGRPPLGSVVKIFDQDGKPVADGVTGRIFVGNQAQFEGYTGGGTKEMIDGLMSIGDLGHFDEDGLLFVEGREDDMIISGGENVFPSEVEDLLHDHPAVAEAAVIGVPDEAFGQRLKAFVVLREGQQLDGPAAKDYVKNHLARHKVPRDVVFLSELPRNPTGKVLKRVLRDMS